MNKNSYKPLRIAVIGAGVRGTGLSRKLSSTRFSAIVVAVAEPDEEKRKSFAKEFNLKDNSVYTGWDELIKHTEDCDAAIVATLDNQHAAPVMACLHRGWHILVEKPLADTFEECLQIDKARKDKKVVIGVCHTLRFMDGFLKVRQILDSGSIGKLIHVEHFEAIGNLRFVHNYVRGRWAQEKNNTFLLLHKCSHDIDYINWLLKESCQRVSSFGSLKYFTPANAPKGSTHRCVDNCAVRDSCQYSAIHMYLDGPLDEWPARDICMIHTQHAHHEAITNGPFGVCVWHANNDVVDHQIVMMEFTGGATATCTLSGYSATNGRRIRLQATLGELIFDEASGRITVKKFSETESDVINITAPDSYHPEDKDILNDWLSSILLSTPVAVDTEEVLRTHSVVFAAEVSRKENRTIEMKEFNEQFNK